MTDPQRPPFAIDFDPAEVRAKYVTELDRRSSVRHPTRATDRSAQRSESGPGGGDPYAAPIEREPVTEDVEMLVIGGGFAGLLTAARAIEAGVSSLRIIEAAGDFGGVWYWNRYPNAQCDTEAYVYLPLLEETGYKPSRRFPYASEIQEHARRVGRHFDLYPRTLFQTEARRLEWSDEEARWTASTQRGDVIHARYVMYSRGAFGLPRIPQVPGIESFTGEIFHASRWNYDYTGGAPGTAPTRLHDKRVAVVGSAATGVQVVSALAPVTGHLHVIQRTPTPLLGDRASAVTDDAWFASLPEGWQRQRRRNFDGNTSGIVQAEDLVKDTWSTTFRAADTAERVLDGVELSDLDADQAQQARELADMEVMERARRYVRTKIEDPETAALLEPWYGMRCKRITFDDGYLAAFNRDNVSLVDAPGTGIERIEGSTITAGGQEFDVDCIVLATGFDTGQNASSRTGLEIIGRDGVCLEEHNREGLRSLHGVMTDGFPNLFATGQGQDPIAVNYTSVLATQSDHIAAILRESRRRAASTIEPTSAAVEEWAEVIDRTSAPFRAYQRNCVPSYFNNDGQADRVGALSATAFTPGVLVFSELIEEWRGAGFPGLKFDGTGVPAQEPTTDIEVGTEQRPPHEVSIVGR